MDGVVAAAEAEDVVAVWAAFAHEFLYVLVVYLVWFHFVVVVLATYAVELDEGADHARAEGALLAWGDVEGHIGLFLVV